MLSKRRNPLLADWVSLCCKVNYITVIIYLFETLQVSLSFRNLFGSIGRQFKLPHDSMQVTVDMPVANA